MLTFSIATPCLNAGDRIAETMLAVLNQTLLLEGTARLQYTILDGGSTDHTCRVAEEIFDRYRNAGHELEIRSRPDRGMYDALADEFPRMHGDFCSYSNAGDYLSPHAFDIVRTVNATMAAPWITGMTTVYNPQGHLIKSHLSFRYRAHLIRCGMYGTQLPVLQQESTFWHRSLNRLIDPERLREFRSAGDFFLWSRFAAETEPTIVAAWIGGFRYHAGHLSAQGKTYRREFAAIATRPRWCDRLQKVLDQRVWRASYRIKKRLNREHLLVFRSESGTYC